MLNTIRTLELLQLAETAVVKWKIRVATIEEQIIELLSISSIQRDELEKFNELIKHIKACSSNGSIDFLEFEKNPEFRSAESVVRVLVGKGFAAVIKPHAGRRINIYGTPIHTVEHAKFLLSILN